MLSRPSSLALVLANLVPLAGVLYFDWSVLAILLLHWAESVVIGVVNVLRMATSRSDNILGGMLPQLTNGQAPEELIKSMPRINMAAFKFFLIPFFTVHYGGFCYGHLMAMLTVIKGLPLTYNRDLQEDKEALFDTVDTLLPIALRVGILCLLVGNAPAQGTTPTTTSKDPYPGSCVDLSVSAELGGAAPLHHRGWSSMG